MTPDIKWIRELSVRSKFNIIITMILLIVVFGLFNFWFSFKIMSGIRAYVGGEGLWSKAQKESVTYLIKYTITYDESDYNTYLKYLDVPLGDRQARLELNKENPDREVIADGFIRGGNSPQDVDDLIFLYRGFKDVGVMKIVINDWIEGDKEIDNLIRTGEEIQRVVRDGSSDAEKAAALSVLTDEVYAIDRRLTIVEDHFSATLGEGSRRMRNFLLFLIIFLNVLLGSIALVISFYIGKITEEVDRFKTEFVSMASHELRTPMAAIKGFVAMILKGRYGEITPQLTKPLKNVSISMERLIKLSNDLLNVARIESGGLKPKIIDCSTEEIIKEVVSELSDLALQKGIKIEIGNIHKGLVKADPGFIGQILHNLIGNAIKFIEKGSISVYSERDSKTQLIFVKDTGIGISKPDQKKVFYKFHQLNSGTGYRPTGSGLGLYISKELSKKMKADLRLEASEPGQGTIFSLALPLSGEVETQTV